MHEADYRFRSKITGLVKRSPEYEKAMDSVELWVLLNNRYKKHHYNIRQLTQIQRKFPHVTSDVNGVAIITGIQSAYSGSKITKN